AKSIGLVYTRSNQTGSCIRKEEARAASVAQEARGSGLPYGMSVCAGKESERGMTGTCEPDTEFKGLTRESGSVK
ncbi:integumentary mucin A.1, partial [Biomphalaria glabrata]